jgi:hypothetical protein
MSSILCRVLSLINLILLLLLILIPWPFFLAWLFMIPIPWPFLLLLPFAAVRGMCLL